MSNLAYNAVKIENIRLEFLNKGLSEGAIDFVLLQNDNYSFEVLKEKMNSLKQQIINVEKSVQKDISSLDAKIDSVEKNLNNKIDNVKNELTDKIENEAKDLRKDLNMGNIMLHLMILAAAIFGPILHALFMRYLQYIK